jgi:hypothetical protein
MPRLESTHDEVLAPATRMLIGIVVAPVSPIRAKGRFGVERRPRHPEPAPVYHGRQSWEQPSAADASIRTARNGQRARDIVNRPFRSGRCSVPIQSRRRFLTNAAFAGAAGLSGSAM